LKINGASNLEKFSCIQNCLSNLHLLLSFLNPKKLTNLRIGDNNFAEKDLKVFSEFTKLESLLISNNNEKHFSQDVYNKFSGSLEPLKNLTYLRELRIDNTDINEGIEYLPNNLEKISHSTEVRPESKVKEIAKNLDNYLTKK